MMPQSVLRPWFLGLFSWAVLGTGIYLLWEWADGKESSPAQTEITVNENAVPATTQQPNGSEPQIYQRNASDGELDRQGGTPYLAWGLALVLFSFVGFLPVLPFLGRPRFDEPRSERAGEQRTVITPDGTEVHVEIYGQNGRPTLLLTHGWSLDSTEWYYVKKEMAARFRVVVWDLPGLGRSQRSKEADYSLEKMARDLEAVLRATSDGPVILVGHSIGGMIVQTFCRIFPQHLSQRVAALALVHTTFTNPLRTALGSTLWTALEKPIIVPLNYLMIWLSPLVWLSNWQSYLNGSLLITSQVSSFAGRQTWGQVEYSSRLFAKASPAVTARGNLEMLSFDEQATLPTINVPVLIVAGGNDRLTKPEASEHLDKMFRHAILTELQPAGHLGHWEQHGEFTTLLAEFVERFGALASRSDASTAASSTASRLESAHGELANDERHTNERPSGPHLAENPSEGTMNP